MTGATFRNPPRAIRPSEQNGRTVVVPVDILTALAPHAAARQITANELARRILDTVVYEGMVGAVLDDGITL